MYGTIAYTAQMAFIQNSTLRENIIYGSAYDEALYERTLQVCALLPDIKVLPAGHDTEIGERGINLSGGKCGLFSTTADMERSILNCRHQNMSITIVSSIS